MLRHFLASAARTTSRSLFAAHFNRSSACVPSSRSIFAQHNKRAIVPIRRAFASQTEAPNKTDAPKQEFDGRAKLIVGVWGGLFVTFLAALVIDTKEKQWARKKKEEEAVRRRMCTAEYDPMPKISENAQSDQSIKKPDLLESAKVTFVIEGPDFDRKIHGLRIESRVDFSLPKTSIDSDYKQICDELARRGIHVDRSEEGARRGLTEYARQYVQKGVEEHLQKKCPCAHKKKGPCPAPKRGNACLRQYDFKPNALESEIPPEKPDVFENGRVWFGLSPIQICKDLFGTTHIRLGAIITFGLPNAFPRFDYEEICDGLKQRGIHVERSEGGSRRGLTEYALKYMQKGVNEHVQKKCRCDKLRPMNCGCELRSAPVPSSVPI